MKDALGLTLYEQRNAKAAVLACEVVEQAVDRYGPKLRGAPQYIRDYVALDKRLDRESKRTFAWIEKFSAGAAT